MPNIAILIDAENVLPAHAEQVMSYAASLGTVVYKEIFGAAQALTSWVEPVLRYALHPNLTIRASKGKNTSDIALVIGAMDLLATGQVNTMVIVSSDSDFSALSVRLRTAGVEVLGMGTEKANPLWRTACTSFEVLQPPARPAAAARPAQPQLARQAQPQRQQQGQQPGQKQAQPQRPAQNPPAARQTPAQQVEAAPKAQQAEPPRSERKGVASTHSGRTAVIRAAILAQLEKNNGLMPASVLFQVLNTLPEYRVDQQRSRRKPVAYLVRQFSDIVQVDERPDGAWIAAVNTARTPAETAETAEAQVPAGEKEQPAAAPEKQPEEAQAEDAQPAGAEPATPAREEQTEETPAVQAEAAPETQADLPQEVMLLMGAGVPQDKAERINEIFQTSGNLRAAYNKLRAAFGNEDGRAFYQLVKELGEGQA